jgi:hypothetical protein
MELYIYLIVAHVEQILEAFHHPYYNTGRSRIQQDMFNEMERWFRDLDQEEAQNILEGLTKVKYFCAPSGSVALLTFGCFTYRKASGKARISVKVRMTTWVPPRKFTGKHPSLRASKAHTLLVDVLPHTVLVAAMDRAV